MGYMQYVIDLPAAHFLIISRRIEKALREQGLTGIEHTIAHAAACNSKLEDLSDLIDITLPKE